MNIKDVLWAREFVGRNRELSGMALEEGRQFSMFRKTQKSSIANGHACTLRKGARRVARLTTSGRNYALL